MEEELEYWTECVACNVEQQVIVFETEEVPQYCAMCGSPMEFQQVEEEEEEEDE